MAVRAFSDFCKKLESKEKKPQAGPGAAVQKGRFRVRRKAISWTTFTAVY
jgi:hypothetical protein